jgi:uncharacterized protein YoaH (UPF0181 family)
VVRYGPRRFVVLTIGKLELREDLMEPEQYELLRDYADGKVELGDEVVVALSYAVAAHRQQSKSSKIRRLAAAGMSRGDISKALGVRFQFVYNTLRKEATGS